jgi:hypothetical protein
VRALDRSPVYVAGLLAVLVLAQTAALATQVARGYRPFGDAPGRVPLSWDMFATNITRCDVHWDPPLVNQGHVIARLSDTGMPFEWDPVYDTLADYVMAARIGCSRAPGGTTVTLLCFTGSGETLHDAFDCR